MFEQVELVEPHGCPEHHRPTKSNTTWWAEKIAANRERDTETTAALGPRDP